MSKLTISLKVSDILFDVTNNAHFTGKSRFDGTNFEQVSNIQVTEDAGEVDVLLRSIVTAKGRLVDYLSTYIRETATKDEISLLSIFTGTETIAIELTLPSLFNLSVKDTIISKCHDYIVDITLGDWLTIVKPDESTVFYNKAENDITALRSAMNKRVMPLRRSGV